MKIAVLTGGGDAPGLNAVIRGVVREASHAGDDVIGFLDGWKGVMENRWMALDVEGCRGYLTRGGTVLGSTRISPFQSDDGIEQCRATLEAEGVDALIAIGGEGTLSCTNEMYGLGFPVLGVPKTIDNDIGATEMTFGFATAVDIATEAIGRLHTTAESHNRVMVVEVMGRHVGHIATWAGMAGGATMTLIPEEPFDIDKVCKALTRRHERKYASIVVVAEGAKPVPGTFSLPEDSYDEFGHIKLGGIGERVAAAITERTGFETRTTVLGYVQRGGEPSAFDRVLATWFGVEAARAANDRDFGTMMAYQCGSMNRVTLEDATAELKFVNPDLYKVAAKFFA
ncbi:MAG: 6-phosphofructokinase [Acidimicrobiales bacterium]